MKKSLVALAVLGAFAGAASAQSNVTLYGIIDTNIQHVSGDGNVSGSTGGSVTRLHEGGVQTSRYGLKGEEDLGGGLKASFVLEGQFSPDSGALGSNTSATTSTDNGSGTATGLFSRRSTVGVSGSFGEVRLGRDYMPDYLVLSGFSAFGINGSAGTLAHNCVGLTGCPASNSFATGVRASNAIEYFLPSNLGGFYGSVIYAFGEQAAAATKDDGRVVGGRIGIQIAGLDATVASTKTTYATTLTAGDIKRTAVGASYVIGAFKPMAFWNSTKVAATTESERKDWGLGLVATFGQHVVRATYHNYDIKNSDNDGKLMGVGYLYNVSKRTSLYANYGRVDNDGTGTAFATQGGRAPSTAGGNSSGYEVGVMHSF